MNGLWTQNTFLQRDEVSLQFVLGLSACVGISFPILDSACVPLLCLRKCIMWHLSSLTAQSLYLSSAGRRQDPWFCSSTKTDKWDLRTAGDQRSLMKLTCLCLFSLWVKHSSIPRAWPVAFSLAIQIPRWGGQKCSDFYSWWLVTSDNVLDSPHYTTETTRAKNVGRHSTRSISSYSRLFFKGCLFSKLHWKILIASCPKIKGKIFPPKQYIYYSLFLCLTI